MPNKKRSSEKSKKRVRFGGAVYKDYSDPANIDLVKCTDNQCILTMGGVDINSNLDEKLLAELRPSDPNASSYLSDELKAKLGLNIQYIYELASCTIKEYIKKGNYDTPGKIYHAGQKNRVEIYQNKKDENSYDVVLENASGRVQISTINKVPDLANDSNLDNKTKVELDLDLHKIVELKKNCNAKIEKEREVVRQLEAKQEAEKRRVAEATRKDKEELQRRKAEAARLKKVADEAAEKERKRIEEADRAATAAVEAKRIADEAREKAAEVARKLKEQQEEEKRRKEEELAATKAAEAERVRLARLAKEEQERLVIEEKERQQLAAAAVVVAAKKAEELKRQQAAALLEKEEAARKAATAQRVADEKAAQEKAATLAANTAAENERRAQEKRDAEKVAREALATADVVAKEAQAEAAKAAAVVAKAAEARIAEATRREKAATATQAKECASWVAKNGTNACVEKGCIYHGPTKECLPPGMKPRYVGPTTTHEIVRKPAISHPLAPKQKDRCSGYTPWQCLVYVMRKINKSFGSLFSFADTDKNDSVSRTEFTVAMNTHIKELDNAKINVVFDLLDLDNNGKLSYNELKSLDGMSYALRLKMSPKEIQEKFPTVRQAISTPDYVSETARVLGNIPVTRYPTDFRGGGKKKTRKTKRSKRRSKKRSSKKSKK